MQILGRYDEYGDFAATLARYRGALTYLESVGVRIATNSRLRNAERRLADLPPDPATAIPSELADQLLFDLREIDEIILVAESIPGPPTEPELERLRVLGAGTDNPDDDSMTRSRDAQFELVLRTELHRGGSTIVLGNPDLLSLDPRGDIPIEAKRPTSERRLDDRLRDALTQLERHPTPGIIALSLDHLARPRGEVLSVPTASALAGATGTAALAFLQPKLEAIANRVRGHRLVALLFVFRTPARARDTGLSLIGSHFHLVPTIDPGGSEAWIIDSVRTALKRGRI